MLRRTHRSQLVFEYLALRVVFFLLLYLQMHPGSSGALLFQLAPLLPARIASRSFAPLLHRTTKPDWQWLLQL
jgi:hypothetical protein